MNWDIWKCQEFHILNQYLNSTSEYSEVFFFNLISACKVFRSFVKCNIQKLKSIVSYRFITIHKLKQRQMIEWGLIFFLSENCYIITR